MISNERIKAASEPFSQSLDVDTATFDTVMMSADDRDSKLFNKILYRIIWNDIIPSLEELRVNKASIAKNVVISIKNILEELGEQWVNAPVQLYFNAMRKNISDFTEFNLNEIKDVVLQSIAAFLLKGEDFESLKLYLETNAFCNYRYAFALWGAVSGYVSMPRSILESEFRKQNIAHLFTETQIALNLNATISFSHTNTLERTLTSLPPNTSDVPNSVSFRNRVIAFFEKIKKGKKNQDLMKEELLAALNQLEDSDNGFLFVCTLNDFSKWRNTSKAWKEMQAEFCPDYETQIGRKPFTENPRATKATQSRGFWGKIGLGGLFRENDGEDTIPSTSVTRSNLSNISKFDFNIKNIEVIMSLIISINPRLSDFALKQIRNDLKWVFDPQYSIGKSQSELIETFRSVLISGKTEPLSKTGKDMKWKNDAYKSLDVERTIRSIKNYIS